MSKTILITGAGSGFGKGAALELARKGHKVIAGVQIAPQKTELLAAAADAGVELANHSTRHYQRRGSPGRNAHGKRGTEPGGGPKPNTCPSRRLLRGKGALNSDWERTLLPKERTTP
ncbi:hypothetical protein GQR58_000531 [Nymphon striatum]|nr:hypothetical protein GQR58_000531 [Nymphon striatum]